MAVNKRYFILSHQVARQNAVKAVMEAPEGMVVRIEEPKRSGEQNSLIHAVLTEYGQSIGWKFNGQSVNLDDLNSMGGKGGFVGSSVFPFSFGELSLT